ncbi:1-acyl-sn-glycerol-3-phosphate acyltransferase [Flavimaricola marinus]|uniref:Glycerol-3-phosphate acyltransferase n=1 Tax=Flavimaricola marinus TaxID=1819565 RepID=A0A238L9H6_9RHOB|nr:1-acyl-sn-glycerol-3-phosphate acyltransferase [Flavimaricola marinus]SMY06055.1 Glycerol-3-phosphate acyltransferase [Flavimaricola marinus]
MTQTVALPLWLLILILLFAAVTFASHFLFPSVRWFFRKRAERLIARLNTRLQRPIEPFKLARRYDMIQRLIYDPQVTEAIVEHAHENNVPENVAFEKARDYAREIVPSFSATAYFTFGTRLARWISRSLYRIKLGSFDRSALDKIDPDAAVIFVMNHRSNMDYVLVTYLVSQTSALSYAVGEWARIWPLSSMIRAMGAYFIRRRNRGGLYRKVLARYVQLAVQGGVTQAFFPEGGLSLTGRVGEPKLGLLNYILSGWQPGGRDVIFVPVALNYDHVLEDRFLIKADKTGVRRFRPPLGDVLRGLGGHFLKRLTLRFKGFGTASVSFGAPLSLAAEVAENPAMDAEVTAQVLMARVRAVMPVLPVPLVSTVLIDGVPRSEATICRDVEALLETLRTKDAILPRREPEAITKAALAVLSERGLVKEDHGTYAVIPGEVDVLAYYARSIEHLFAQEANAAAPIADLDVAE